MIPHFPHQPSDLELQLRERIEELEISQQYLSALAGTRAVADREPPTDPSIPVACPRAFSLEPSPSSPSPR